jgi:quercetin dioxygenase-like cupin family protein
MPNGPGVIHRPSAEAALRILLGERDCDGALGVVEMAFAPGDTGPPLHVHPTHAEAFYVLAGDLSLQVGDEVVTGGPGTWACAPKNVPHTVANLGAHAGRSRTTDQAGWPAHPTPAETLREMTKVSQLRRPRVRHDVH